MPTKKTVTEIVTDNWKMIGAVLSVLITVVTMSIKLDTRWAYAEHVKQLELRLDQKIDADRMDRIQERIWRLDDRFPGGSKMPDIVKEEYRKLLEEKKLIEQKLKK